MLFLAGSVGFAVGTRTAGEGGGSAAEVGFLHDMIAHHEQAVEMSRTALAGDLPPGIESFAIEVVADQQYETGLMETVLRRWGHPRQRADGESMAWMGEAVAVERMPGMASGADLERLADARGDEAGALWLALMTNHHLGGVHMAEAALERVDDAVVRDLAKRTARNQRIEVNEYAAARVRLGLPVPEGLQSAAVPDARRPGHDGGH
jgi:uncharacterized protein (DUF305 family)